jgi:hypothetical protein
MAVTRSGIFEFTINSEALVRGLRPSKRAARNTQYLIECVGAVGYDKVLQVIDDLEENRINTAVIVDTFPYPQIFVFTNLILVCGKTNIYSWDGTTLTHEIGPVATGELWSAIAFHNFVYMSNRKVSITRDPNTGIFAIDADQPIVGAIADFNGQVFVGSPVEAPTE